LWQIPFLGVVPRHLLTGIGSGVGFSADGRRMAYVRDGDVGQTEVVVAASDGSGAHVLATRRAPDNGFWTIPGAGGLGWFAPAWSPDGATLAVLGRGAGFVGHVVFIDTRTGSEERSFDVGSPIPGVSAAWLNEGMLLLSMVDRSSAPLQLWLLSYPQGEFSRLTNDTSQYFGVNLTDDRNQLVTARSEGSFSISTSDASAARWTRTIPTTPVKGPIGFGVRWLGDDLVYPSSASGAWALERWRASTGRTQILAPAGGAPQVSRDGSLVAYFDYDTGELWRMDADGRNRTLASRGPDNHRITPDGLQVTFVETAAGGPPAVHIRPIDGAEKAREITADRVRPGSALVSPDGQWIAYPAFDDQNRPAVGVCDLLTCSSTRTFPLGSAWTPDSQGLAYVVPGTRSDIWIQPLDGGAPRQLTQFPPDGQEIWDFAWSADGQRLAVGRASITNNIVLFRGLKQPAR
jgi:Tol biopolymer transport system component